MNLTLTDPRPYKPTGVWIEDDSGHIQAWFTDKLPSVGKRAGIFLTHQEALIKQYRDFLWYIEKTTSMYLGVISDDTIVTDDSLEVLLKKIQAEYKITLSKVKPQGPDRGSA